MRSWLPSAGLLTRIRWSETTRPVRLRVHGGCFAHGVFQFHSCPVTRRVTMPALARSRGVGEGGAAAGRGAAAQPAATSRLKVAVARDRILLEDLGMGLVRLHPLERLRSRVLELQPVEAVAVRLE